MYLSFQLIATVILLGIQFYFYRLISGALQHSKSSRWRKAVQIVFAVMSILLIPLLFFRSALYQMPGWLVGYVAFPFYIWHFTSFFLFLLMMVRMLVWMPGVLAKKLLHRIPRSHAVIEKITRHPKFERFDSTRRRFMRYAGTAMAAATLSASVYGAFRRNEYEITAMEVPIRELPDEFLNMTITLISDIHSSIFMTKEEMKRYAGVVNDLQSELVVVDGDFVNSMVEEVYPFAEAFSELRAPMGVYGVLGNHDYYTGDVETVAKEVNRCGIRLLRNAASPITKGKSSLLLLGVDDVGSGLAAAREIDSAMEDAPTGIPRILLCHRPYFFRQAAERNIDLVLSGHTHGGQIVFMKTASGIIAPARMASPYVAGMYTRGSSQMYVSRGIGTVAIPVRINCPPEVTKFTLVRA